MSDPPTPTPAAVRLQPPTLAGLTAQVATTCVLTCARCDYRVIGSEATEWFAVRRWDEGWRPGMWRGQVGALCPACARRKR